MQLCKAAIAGEGAATTLRMAPVTLLRRQDLATWEAMTTPAETGTGGGVDIEGGAELAARVPLDRYGVVFRRLCTREPCLPPWRELVAVCRPCSTTTTP